MIFLCSKKAQTVTFAKDTAISSVSDKSEEIRTLVNAELACFEK